MGCYMSKPDNKVYVTEGAGNNFTYATASCQGWRREQEDAEDCLPYFDDDASLFILCDGHGGAEVAKYTVAHFPTFFKNHPLYKEGKYVEALEKSFVEFDALLRTEEVERELQRLALQVDDPSKQTDSELNVKSLLDEDDAATTTGAAGGPSSSSSAASSSSSLGPASDQLPGASTAGPSSSKAGPASSALPDDVVEDVDSDTLRKEAQIPLQVLLDEQFSGRIEEDKLKLDSAGDSLESQHNQPVPSSSHFNPNQPGSSSSKNTETIHENIIKQVIQHYFPEEDTSDDSEYDMSKDVGVEGDDEEDDGEVESKSKRLQRRKRRNYQMPLTSSDEDEDDDDDDDSDEDDDDDDSDDDDNDQDDDDEDEDASEDEDEEDEDEEFGDDDRREDSLNDIEDDEEEEEDDEENTYKPGLRVHKPGVDSGCTIVVALLKNKKLYVASAGDSRCIVIKRSGECKPMSFDHKPEDLPERKRIMLAGGKVTEGRVNGGLNLSRALGDFTYKNPKLEAKDQMITPCPDVMVTDLNYDEVEYVFLACDGIWNSKNNNQTTKFIRKTAKLHNNDLIEICLNLFRACIAPLTDGDGTGCDNMTCIIARFEDPNQMNAAATSDLNKEPVEGDTTKDGGASSSKRRSTNEEDSEDVSKCKRRCLQL